jgi:hypothetical protein
MPRACRRLQSALSTSLDRFTLDLDCFAWSTSSPPTLEHTVDLDRFARSTPLPLAPEHTVDLDRFTQSTPPPLAPEHAVDLSRFTDDPAGKIQGSVPKAKMGHMFMLIILYISIEYTLQCIKNIPIIKLMHKS